MKRQLILFLSIVLLFSVSCNNKKNDGEALTLASYSSFLDEWGAGSEIISAFEAENGIKVNMINAGTGAELVTYIKDNYEKKNVDVVVGISDDFIDDNLDDYVENLEAFDYSYYAFLIAKNSKITPPKTLFDLLKPEYNKQFILIDPRTSSVGLGLLYWTYSVLGKDDAIEWWKGALDNALTVASSWSEGYGLFTNGEAPIVISYYTSPWYDMYNGDEPYAETLEFEDGHIKCSEYMGVLKNAPNKTNAEKFIEFMKSEKSQEALSAANVMYPVVNPSFVRINEPKNVVTKIDMSLSDILDSWSREVL